jgi:hypothetical protein
MHPLSTKKGGTNGTKLTTTMQSLLERQSRTLSRRPVYQDDKHKAVMNGTNVRRRGEGNGTSSFTVG